AQQLAEHSDPLRGVLPGQRSGTALACHSDRPRGRVLLGLTQGRPNLLADGGIRIGSRPDGPRAAAPGSRLPGGRPVCGGDLRRGRRVPDAGMLPDTPEAEKEAADPASDPDSPVAGPGQSGAEGSAALTESDTHA